MREYTPVRVTHPKPGVAVYDLGQNFAGWPKIAVEGPAGAVVRLIPGELLDKDGLVWQRSSGRPQWFAYTLRGAGMEVWQPRFSYYGFRYVQVETRNTGAASRAVRVLRLSGEAVHSSSRQVGEFASSDELLNRIHALILRAIENNAESLFTDCPHREKLGWLEETHLIAPSMLYDFDFCGLVRRHRAQHCRRAAAAMGRRQAWSRRSRRSMSFSIPQNTTCLTIRRSGEAPRCWRRGRCTSERANREFLAAQYDVMRAYVGVSRFARSRWNRRLRPRRLVRHRPRRSGILEADNGGRDGDRDLLTRT